jgi:hypothetical protein
VWKPLLKSNLPKSCFIVGSGAVKFRLCISCVWESDYRMCYLCEFVINSVVLIVKFLFTVK